MLSNSHLTDNASTPGWCTCPTKNAVSRSTAVADELLAEVPPALDRQHHKAGTADNGDQRSVMREGIHEGIRSRV